MRSTNSDGSIYLKRCPRCCGDIHASRDRYGRYIHCLQCGYAADIARPNPFAAALANIRRDEVA